MSSSSLGAQIQRMERSGAARKHRFALTDRHITLSHGSGGKATHNLVEGLIAPILDNRWIRAQEDSAVFAPNGRGEPRLAFTTDAYVVSPVEFPGGDIGKLAVHGTINDLAVAGARPLCLSASLILEEGLDIDLLRRVVQSMADAASAAGVAIVTGDTKVVERGKADRLFITTSGVGLVRTGITLSLGAVRPGDRVLLSGSIGDHGLAVMLAREALELETPIVSDTAAIHELVDALLDAAPSTRCLKDPTRGGLATSLNEIALQSGVAIAIDEEAIPLRREVRGACEILGLDPLHIANEGKLIAVVPEAKASAGLAALRRHPLGLSAAVIGEVLAEPREMVLLRTTAGGSRVVDMLVGDPLPRIC